MKIKIILYLVLFSGLFVFIPFRKEANPSADDTLTDVVGNIYHYVTIGILT